MENPVRTDQARLQIQDVTGAWINIGSTINQDQVIFQQLGVLSSVFKRLVRAVDKHDNILQILE